MSVANWDSSQVSQDERDKLGKPAKKAKSPEKSNKPNLPAGFFILTFDKKEYTLIQPMTQLISKYDVMGEPKNNNEIKEVKCLWVHPHNGTVKINGVVYHPLMV